jgi:hypothetical protein
MVICANLRPQPLLVVDFLSKELPPRARAVSTAVVHHSFTLLGCPVDSRSPAANSLRNQWYVLRIAEAGRLIQVARRNAGLFRVFAKGVALRQVRNAVGREVIRAK